MHFTTCLIEQWGLLVAVLKKCCAFINVIFLLQTGFRKFLCQCFDKHIIEVCKACSVRNALSLVLYSQFD